MRIFAFRASSFSIDLSYSFLRLTNDSHKKLLRAKIARSCIYISSSLSLYFSRYFQRIYFNTSKLTNLYRFLWTHCFWSDSYNISNIFFLNYFHYIVLRKFRFKIEFYYFCRILLLFKFWYLSLRCLTNVFYIILSGLMDVCWHTNERTQSYEANN